MNKLWIFFWCTLVLLFDGTWQMGLRLSRRKEACCYFALNGHYPQHIPFYTPEELNFHRIWKLTDKAIQHTCFPLLRRKLQTIFRPPNVDKETYYKMRDFFYNYRRWSGCRRSNIFGEYLPMETYPYPDDYEDEVRKPQTVMQRFGPTEHNAKSTPTKSPKDSPKESFIEHVESEATEDSLEITIGYEETSNDSVGSEGETSEDYVSYPDDPYKDGTVMASDYNTRPQEPLEYEDEIFKDYHSHKEEDLEKVLRFNPETTLRESLQDKDLTKIESSESEEETPDHAYKDKDSTKIIIDYEATSQKPAESEDNTPEDFVSLPEKSYKDENLKKMARARSHEILLQESEDRSPEDLASPPDDSYKNEDTKKIIIDRETTSLEPSEPEDSTPEEIVSIPDQFYRDEDLTKIARGDPTTSREPSGSEDRASEEIASYLDHSHKDEDSKKIVIDQETTSQEPSGPEDSTPEVFVSIPDRSYNDEDLTKTWEYPTTSREYSESEDKTPDDIASYSYISYKDEDSKKIITDPETTSRRPSGREDSTPDDLSSSDHSYKDEGLTKIARDFPTTSREPSGSEDRVLEDIASSPDIFYKDEDSKKIVIDQETTSQEPSGPEDDIPEDPVLIPDYSYKEENLMKIARDYPTTSQGSAGSDDRASEDVTSYPDHFYKDEDAKKIIIDQETTSQEPSGPRESTPEDLSFTDHSYKDEDLTKIAMDYATTSRESLGFEDTTFEDVASYPDHSYKDEDSIKIVIDQATSEPSGSVDKISDDLALHSDDSYKDDNLSTIAEDQEIPSKTLSESSEDFVSPLYDSHDIAGSSNIEPEAGDLEVKFYSDIFDTSSTTASVKNEDLHLHQTNKDVPNTNYGKLPKKTVLVSLDGRFGGIPSSRDEVIESTTLGDDEIEEDVTKTSSTDDVSKDFTEDYINVYEETSVVSSEEHTATTDHDIIQSSITEHEEESTTDPWEYYATSAETSDEVESESTATETSDYRNPWYSLTESPDTESYSKMTDDFQNAGSSMTQGSDENHSVPSGNHSGSIEEYDEDDHTMPTTLVYTDPTLESGHEISYRIHKGDEDENKGEDDMTENEDDQHVITTTDLEDVDESIEVIDDLDEKLDDWPKSTSDEDELKHKPVYSHYDDKLMVETTKTPYENDYSEEFYDDSAEVSSHTSKFEDKSTNIPIISIENYHEEHTHLEHSTTETAEEQSGERTSTPFEVNEDHKERYSEDFEQQHQRTTTESYQEHTTVIYNDGDDYVGITKGADHYKTTTNDEEPTMITESFGDYEYYPREQEAITDEEDSSATDDSRKYEDIEEIIGMIHEENNKSNEEITYEHSESTITTEDYFTNAKYETYQDESTMEDDIAPSTTGKSKDYENYPREQETTTDEEDSTVTYRSQEYGDIEEKVHAIHEENLEIGEETMLPIATESYPNEQEATTQQGRLSATDRSKEYENIEQRDDISHNEELQSDEDATNEENYSPNATEDDFTVTTDEAYRTETASEIDDMLTTTEESKGYENYPREQEITTDEGDPTETDHSKEYGDIEERVGINHEEELKSDVNATYQDNTVTTEEAYKYESTTRDVDTTTTNEQPTTNVNSLSKEEPTTQEDDSTVIYTSKLYEDSEESSMIHEEKHESDEESKHEENKLPSSVAGDYTITTDEPYRYESTTEDDEEPTTKEDSNDYESQSNYQETTIHEDDSTVTYQSRQYENIEDRVGMIHEDELKYNEDAANEDNEYPNASEDYNTSTTEETHWYDTITRDRDTTTTNDQSTAFEKYPSEEEVTRQEDDSAVTDRSREYEDIEDRVGMIHEEEGAKNRDNEYPNASEDDNTSRTEETHWYDTITRDRDTTTTNDQSTAFEKYPSEEEVTRQEDDSAITDQSRENEDIEDRLGMIREEELKSSEGAKNRDNEYPNASEDDNTSATEETYWYDTTTRDRYTATTNQQSTTYDKYPSEQEATTKEDDSFVTDRSKEYEDNEERVGMIHEEELKPNEGATNEDNEYPNASEDDNTSTTEETYWYDTTIPNEHSATYENYRREQETTTQVDDPPIKYRSKEYEDIEERGGMIHEEEFEADTDTTAGVHESPGGDDHTSPTEEAYRYETTTYDEDRSTVKKETILEDDSVGTESDEYFNDRIRIAPEDYYYSTKENTNDENTSTIPDEDVSTATTLGDNQYETTEGRENSSSATEKTKVYENSSEEKETSTEEDIDDRDGMIQDKEYELEEETTNYDNESTTTVVEDDYTSTSDSSTATYEEGSSVTEYNRENEDIEERQDMIGEENYDSDEETRDYEYKVTTAAKEENYYTVENEGEEITSGYDVDEDHRSALGKSQHKESTFVTDGSTKYEVIEDRIGEAPEDKYESEEVGSSDGNEYLEKELTTDEYTEKSTKSDDVYKSAIEDQEDSTSTAQEEDRSQAKVDTDFQYEDYKGGIYSTVNTEPANENEDSNGTTTEEMIRTTEKEDTSSEEEHMVEEIEGRVQNSDEDDKSFLEVVANPEVDEHEISTTVEEDQVTATEEGSVTDRKEEYEDFVADKETYRDVESTTQIEEKPYVMRIPSREPHDLHLVGESYEDAIPDNQRMTESEQVSEEIFNQDPTGGYDDDEKKDPGSVSVEGSTTMESGSNTQVPNTTTEENLDVSGQTTTKRNKLSSQPTKPRKSLVKKIKEEINSRLGI